VSIVCVASVRPYLVPCFNLVPCSLEPPAHTFRALESCWHAGKGLPCCPVTSSGTSGAASGRASEEYQVRARYQVRANPLLPRVDHTYNWQTHNTDGHAHDSHTRLTGRHARETQNKTASALNYRPSFVSSPLPAQIDRQTHTHIYTYMCVCVYIYIYIYVHLPTYTPAKRKTKRRLR